MFCFDRLFRCVLSPLPGLVGGNAPFPGLTPWARIYRAYGAMLLVRNAGYHLTPAFAGLC